MTTIASLMVRVGADLADFYRGMDAAADRIERTGDRMQRLGQDLTLGVTVPLAAIGVTALKSSVSFESAFAGVRKTVDATEEQFAELRKGILAMAREVPASANEIAAVAEAAGQLGIANENLLSFTRTMIDLGESTNLSATEAATALARFANITQLPQDQISNLGSTIVDLGNKMATTESEIVNMGLRIAAAGQQIGLTDAQILAFAASLSSVGIEAEAGGTAISRAFIEVANAVRSGTDELPLFAEVAGMSVAEFRRAFEDDAAGAMLAFIEGLGNVEEAGGNVFAVLEELGLNEVRLRNALLASASAGDLVRESLGIASDAFAENSALSEEAARRYETTGARLEMLRNRLTETAIQLGDALAPALLDAIAAGEPFIRLIERAVDVFTALPTPIQSGVIAFGALAAAAGPATFVIGQYVSMTAQLIRILPIATAALGTFAGPLGLGLIIVTAGAALFAIKQVNDAINEAREAASRQTNVQHILDTHTVDEISKTIDNLRQRLAELDRQMKQPNRGWKAAEKLIEQVDILKGQLDLYEGALDQVRAAQEQQSRSTDGVTTAAEEMAGATAGAAGAVGGLGNESRQTAVDLATLNVEATLAGVAVDILAARARGGIGGFIAMGQAMVGLATAAAAIQKQAQIRTMLPGLLDLVDPAGTLRGPAGVDVSLPDATSAAAGAVKTAVDLMLEEFQRFADFAPRALGEVTAELDLYRQAAIEAGDTTVVSMIDNLLALGPTASEVRQAIGLLQAQFGDLKAELEEALTPIEATMQAFEDLAARAPHTMEPLVEELMLYRDAAEQAGDTTSRDLIDALLALDPTAAQVRSAIGSMQAAYGDLAQAALDAARAVEEANRLVEEGLAKARQAAISELDFLGGAITTALRRQLDAQMDGDLAAIEAQRIVLQRAAEQRRDIAERSGELSIEVERRASERRLEVLRAEHDRAVAMLEAQAAAAIAPLQAQLDALDALDRAEQADDFEDRLREIDRAIKIAYDPRKYADLIQQREEVLEDIAAAERDIQREGIRDQISAIEDNMREQQRLLDEQLRAREDAERTSIQVRERAMRESIKRRDDAEQASLQRQLDALSAQEEQIRAKYAAQTEQWVLESRAREMVMNGEMSAIVALLEEFYPEWRSAGRSFGEQLIDGLRTSNVEAEITRILGMFGVLTGTGTGPTLQDLAADLASIARLIAGGAPAAAINMQRASFEQIYGFASPLANGGLITRPTLAYMGEVPRARPEIVSPVPTMKDAMRDVMREMGPPTVNLVVKIGERDITDIVDTQIREHNVQQRRAAQLNGIPA